MSDLIDRQAAIDRINKQREHLQPDIYSQDKIGDAAYMVCAEFIERLPSAQPERKRGKWVRQRDKAKLLYGWLFCSECGAFIGRESNFCSECGADMRGVSE